MVLLFLFVLERGNYESVRLKGRESGGGSPLSAPRSKEGKRESRSQTLKMRMIKTVGKQHDDRNDIILFSDSLREELNEGGGVRGDLPPGNQR